jgi:hypothetical protein
MTYARARWTAHADQAAMRQDRVDWVGFGIEFMTLAASFAHPFDWD